MAAVSSAVDIVLVLTVVMNRTDELDSMNISPLLPVIFTLHDIKLPV